MIEGSGAGAGSGSTNGNEKNIKFADIISSKETKTPIKFMII
jgi:hypothetical protein